MLHTTHELRGYGLGILTVDEPVFQDGQPVFNRDGSAKVERLTKLMAQSPDGTHVVILRLAEQARIDLIKALTGGVVVSNGNLALLTPDQEPG